MIQKQKGFTLVEMMVVLVIIALVAAVLLLTFMNIQRNSRNRQRMADLESIRAALERYRDDSPDGKYPATPGVWYSSEEGDNHAGVTYQEVYVPELSPKYLTTLPSDPVGGNSSLPSCTGWKSAYLYRSDGNHFKILAHCSPEGSWDENHPYYDEARPSWAWAVCSDNMPSDDAAEDEICKNW